MRFTYQDYENAKAGWIRKNPAASSQEYERAMRAIARRMGL